jgi:glyceraldehyde-3-phosphate dehydrogenase (NAD(P))
VLEALKRAGLLKKARAVLLRRATDPWESHKGGMINTLLPEPRVPSHQGPDAQTVDPDLDVITIAASGPFNLAHTHFAIVEAPTDVDRDAVLRALGEAPRIAFIRASDGVEAANSVIEVARYIGRPRADLWEVALWEDTLAVWGNEIFLTYVVHNEAIVTPENIDAIRAVSGIERDAAKSIAQTDQTLGLRDELP